MGLSTCKQKMLQIINPPGISPPPDFKPPPASIEMNSILTMFWSLKMLVNSKVFWSALSFSFFENVFKTGYSLPPTHGYKTSKDPLRSCISRKPKV